MRYAILTILVMVWSVGGHAQIENFKFTTDANPMTNLWIEGSDTLDVTILDGQMYTQSGWFNNIVAATTTSGELYFKARESIAWQPGLFMYAKLVNVQTNNTVGESSNPQIIFGLSDASDTGLYSSLRALGFGFQGGDINKTIFIVDDPQFSNWSSRFLNFPVLDSPIINDTTEIFIAYGHKDTTSGEHWAPYYAGKDSAKYPSGALFFLRKKRISNNWFVFGSSKRKFSNLTLLLNSTGNSCSQCGHVRIDEILVGKSNKLTHLYPIHYTSGKGAAGTNFTSVTPEIGNGWNVVNGSWELSGDNQRRIRAATVGSGAIGTIAYTDAGKKNVLIEVAINRDTTPESAFLVLRFNTQDSSFVMVGYHDTGTLQYVRIWEYTGGLNGTFNQVASADITEQVQGTSLISAQAFNDTISVNVVVPVASGGDSKSLNYTTTLNNTSTLFGFRADGSNAANIEYMDFTVYALGTNGEYADIDNIIAQYGNLIKWPHRRRGLKRSAVN